jgi:hypothetical protein
MDVDVVHAPRGWQDPELFTAPANFLQGMRPLLDAYLAVQGEAPLQELEWQVCEGAGFAAVLVGLSGVHARSRLVAARSTGVL